MTATVLNIAPDRKPEVAPIQALRAAIRLGDAPTDLLSHLDQIEKELQRLATEQSGMTEEVLALYEHVGIIFEITSKLPEVRDEGDLVGVILDSVGRTFADRQVALFRCSADGAWSGEPDAIRLNGWLGSLLERARTTKRVVVEAPAAGSNQALAEALVGPVFSGEAFFCAVVLARSAAVRPFHARDMLLMQSLAQFCGDLIANHRLLHELRQISIATVRSLVNAVDQKDPYTCGHSLRVAYFATMLARELEFSREDLQMLQWAALLHDIGKIGIRDDVLKKEGKLTDEEFAHIKEHPVRSHSVIREVPQLTGALDGVLYHHEHYDGKGYPSGLVGERIPLQARVIQIADVFDALTSRRAYRHEFGWEKALDILRAEAGTTVDPNLQRVFDVIIRRQLEGAPEAWGRLLEQANQFAQDPIDPPNVRARSEP